jgi:hypothetical protein
MTYARALMKPSRWLNKPERCNEGVMQQSGMEAARCTELHLLLRAGEITDLEAHPQPRLDLVVNDVKVGAYLPDFVYHDVRSGQKVVEDVKGQAGMTAVYQLKKKLVLACHGIEITEVTRVRGRR